MTFSVLARTTRGDKRKRKRAKRLNSSCRIALGRTKGWRIDVESYSDITMGKALVRYLTFAGSELLWW